MTARPARDELRAFTLVAFQDDPVPPIVAARTEQLLDAHEAEARREPEQQLAELLGEVESLRTAARSASVLLRSTADRAESGQRIDPATLRHAARALDDITAKEK